MFNKIFTKLENMVDQITDEDINKFVDKTNKFIDKTNRLIEVIEPQKKEARLLIIELEKLDRNRHDLELELNSKLNEIKDFYFKYISSLGDTIDKILLLEKYLFNSESILEDSEIFINYFNDFKLESKEISKVNNSYFYGNKYKNSYNQIPMFLKNEILSLKHRISNLELRIKELNENETFIFITNLPNLDEYINNIKISLLIYLRSLEEQKELKEKVDMKNKEQKDLINQFKLFQKDFKILVVEKLTYENQIEEFNTKYYLYLGEVIENIFSLKVEKLHKEIYTKNVEFQNKKEEYNKNLQELNLLISELQTLKTNLFRTDILDDKFDKIYEKINLSKKEYKEKLEITNNQKIFIDIYEKDFKNDVQIKEYELAKTDYESFIKEYKNVLTQNKYSPNKIEKINLKLDEDDSLSTYTQEILQSKIKDIELSIEKIKLEIEDITSDETFEIIKHKDNWDKYFTELKNELTIEYKKIKEDIEILEDSNNIQKIEIESSDYSKRISDMSVPTFVKICTASTSYMKNESFSDEKNLNLYEYLNEYGKRDKAILYSAFETFLEKLDGQKINVIDWGSQQGIATILLQDFIREKQLKIETKEIVLILPSIKSLNRAMLYCNILNNNKEKIFGINKKLENLLEKEFNLDEDAITINIFYNIENLDKNIYEKIRKYQNTINDNYFIVLSSQSEHDSNNIFMYYKNYDAKLISERIGKIGKYNRNELIFEFTHDEIPF